MLLLMMMVMVIIIIIIVMKISERANKSFILIIEQVEKTDRYAFVELFSGRHWIDKKFNWKRASERALLEPISSTEIQSSSRIIS